MLEVKSCNIYYTNYYPEGNSGIAQTTDQIKGRKVQKKDKKRKSENERKRKRKRKEVLQNEMKEKEKGTNKLWKMK